MPFSDLAFARRLERAEGRACVQFAVARSRLFPAAGAAWMECAGAYSVFDGVGSPVTQTFGLGLFEEPTPSALHAIERFFLSRGATVDHEVSPFAGHAALALLCDRGYRPIEISNVLWLPLEAAPPANPAARLIAPEEASTIASLRGRGLQTLLLRERLRFAAARRCDLAMLVAEPGSRSQRNAERQGFRVAYTRIKWRLRTP